MLFISNIAAFFCECTNKNKYVMYPCSVQSVFVLEKVLKDRLASKVEICVSWMGFDIKEGRGSKVMLKIRLHCMTPSLLHSRVVLVFL